MGFRVIHHEGDKDLLFEVVKATADQIKNTICNECGKRNECDKCDKCIDNFQADDLVVNGNFSRSKHAPDALSIVINTRFRPVSDDWYITGYLRLADKTSGKLAITLRMFVEGRDFSTGDFGFGTEKTCGYLNPDEVREFLSLLKAYNPDNDDDKALFDYLIDVYSRLVEKNSGDLFIMI